jgi:hypothetical protein
MPDGETPPVNVTAFSDLVFQVGDKSCGGTMSCARAESPDAVVTIENDSCNGVSSCHDFASTSTIGNHSCNAQKSCTRQIGAFVGEFTVMLYFTRSTSLHELTVIRIS